MIVVLIQPPEGTAWRRVRDNLTRNAASAPTRAEQAEAAKTVSTRSSPGPQSSFLCSWSSGKRLRVLRVLGVEIVSAVSGPPLRRRARSRRRPRRRFQRGARRGRSVLSRVPGLPENVSACSACSALRSSPRSLVPLCADARGAGGGREDGFNAELAAAAAFFLVFLVFR